jgi:hypothetical protein
MELLKQIGMSLLAVGFGVFGIAWQIFQWRGEMPGRLIIWIGIIPVPIGLVGLLSFIVGAHELGKLMHLF